MAAMALSFLQKQGFWLLELVTSVFFLCFEFVTTAITGLS